VDSRSLRLIGPIILAATALVGVLWALGFGGGAAPLLLADAGPVVRWGIPIAKLVVNLSGAGMVGSVVIALFALKPGQKSFERALDVTSISAAVFAAAAAAVGIFSSASAVGAPISLDDTFGSTLGRFLGTEAGITWLITTLAGAAISVLAFAARGWFVSAVTAALAIAAMVPMATQGHSGDLANHNITLTAMVLHTVGAAVWVGGLLTLVIIRPLMRKRMVDVLYRYSTLALVSFIVVTLSGVVRAYVAVGDWSALATPYGILVLAKTALLALLGVAGAMYRRRLIAQGGADSTGGPFWTLVAVELALMGLASGIAAALARSEPPTGLAPTPVQTPARIMTGSDLPPELTPMRWLTQWDVDILWALAIMFGAFFYIAGVVRLRRRGDSWPIYRTVLWFVGLLLLLWVTCGPVNAYGDYLFSVHMLGHMLLTMAIPLCLVAGAPVTLALRTIHKRTDGTRGGREWILWAVHSPFSRIITHPIVAAAIFVASLWVAVRPPRPRVDDRPLPDLGVSVRAVADRRGPDPLPLPARRTTDHPHRGGRHARVLRHGDHDEHRADGGRVVRLDGASVGSHSDGGPVHRRRHRVVDRRDPHADRRHHGGHPVEPVRCPRPEAQRSARRSHGRSGAGRIQRTSGSPRRARQRGSEVGESAETRTIPA
jgi:putative copper export protein